MNSYYGSVNGPACHYVRLAKYNRCSLAEAQATPQPSSTDFNYYKTETGSSAGATEAKVQARMAASGTRGAPESVSAIGGTKESFIEGLDTAAMSGMSEEQIRNMAAADYSPSYTVPNYPSINADSLTYGSSCGSYPSIMQAYGKNAGNCVTNFITN